MKKLLLLCFLPACLLSVSNAQNQNKNLIHKFLAGHKHLENGRIPDKQFWIKEVTNLQSIKKNNDLTAYGPVKATCDDTSRYIYTYDNKGNKLSESYERKSLSDTIWTIYERFTYTYDNNGNMLNELIEERSDGVLGNSGITTCTYDDNANMLTELYKHWSNGDWENAARLEYSYDNNNNPLTLFFYEWNDSTWVRFYSITITYDDESNVLTILTEESGSYGIDTFTYDNDGNMITELSEYWQNGVLKESDKISYTYDNKGNMLTKAAEELIEGVWVNRWRDTYTYDTNSNITSYISKDWSNGDWLNSLKKTLTYDINNNLLKEFMETWDDHWVNHWTNTYTYDINGKMLSYLEQYYSNDAWLNNILYTYAYDNNGNAVSGRSFHWRDSSWVPIYGNLKMSYNDNKDFLLYISAVVEVEYSVITSVRDEYLTDRTFSLAQNYPNPFNPVTTINYEISERTHVELSVFDMLGREVTTIVNKEQDKGNYSAQFDAAHLSSGIYLYRIKAGNYVKTNKMTLLK